MLNIFKNLRKIWVEPKVFSVVFRSEKDHADMVVWQVGAYTLEEAIFKSKRGIADALSEKEFDEASYKMVMFASDYPEKLMKEFVEEQEKREVRGLEDKGDFKDRLKKALGLKESIFTTKVMNADEAVNPEGESANAHLMKKIIEESNLDLLEKSKALLSQAEVRYVEGKIKNKK